MSLRRGVVGCLLALLPLPAPAFTGPAAVTPTPAATRAAEADTRALPDLLARPDADMPPEGAFWLAGEEAPRWLGAGAVTLGTRPLPGLMLALHQTGWDDGTVEVRFRLWPERGLRPALMLGAQGLGGLREDRALFLAAGYAVGPIRATAGLSWQGDRDHGNGPGLDRAPHPWGSMRFQPGSGRFALQLEGGRVGYHREPRLSARLRLHPSLELSVGAERSRGAFAGVTLLLPMERIPQPSRIVGPGLQRADREVWVEVEPATPLAREVGRAARHFAPPEGEITVHTHSAGLPGVAMRVMATDLARAAAHRGSLEEIAANARFLPARPPPADWTRWQTAMALTLDHGPAMDDSGWAGRIHADAGLSMQRGGFRAQAALRLTLENATGDLPMKEPEYAVRSDLPDHAAAGVALARLQMGWAGRLAPDLLALVEAGHLEEMFAGLGGELRWQPFEARYGLGLELHHVWKREPGHITLWRGTGRTTGFLTASYDLPARDVTASLGVGRFLGGDVGIRIGLDRWFDNGARIGAELVHAGQEGESGLALTLRLRVPLDGVELTGTGVELLARPQGRDAGQRLDRADSLADSGRASGFGRLVRDWRQLAGQDRLERTD